MTKLMQLDVLSDINERGRERPWRTHKVANEYISAAYEAVNPDKAVRLRNCATTLSFQADNSGKKKLVSANFCRVRLCPVCTWRRSLKVAGQVHKIMAAIADSDEKLRYIFLTLTVKNCTADKLSDTITDVMKSFDRLTRQLPFDRVVVGWYRALEVTHNLDRSSADFDTFHPHFHCILAVKPSYFCGKNYISQEKWSRMWKQALRSDYTPVVDVRIVKGDTARAVAEAAKYSTKAGDIIIPDDWNLTIATLRVLDSALDRRRLVAFGGRFKAIHAALRLDNADDGDLVHTSDEADSDQEGPIYSYAWYSGYRQYGRVE